MELLKFDSLVKLAVAASNKTSFNFSESEKYSAEQTSDLLRAQMNLLAGDYRSFRENKNTIFSLIEQTIDEVLPAKVLQQYEQFADISTVAQGDKVVFVRRITEASRMRAKQFVTQVGLAGRYETFMLDGERLEVKTSAIGSAARIGFEEFLDGRIQFSDLTDVIIEAMDEYIYREIAKALATAVEELPAPNKVTASSFDSASMDRLLAIADAYAGAPATIYCTYEFAATMLPAEAWASNDMKNTIWGEGYLPRYKGHNIVLLPQSMEDATNAKKVIDPSNAYIINSGVEKPVKIAFEGQTAVREVSDNDDWSRDMQTYKKFGVAILTNPSICVYKNSSLKLETV
jgi:hypothetical protein